MKTYSATWLCIITGIAATTALAQTNKTDPPAQVSPLAQPSEVTTVLKTVTQIQSDVKALQTEVENLAAI